ncbi:MAG: clan AA aspartic protease [Candidatus Caldarchaeum sp.]|nr:clan AA aspartic protease [Candidatus Caldarchaeum sp.]MDW7977445.1 hypothetical protein [Candidatus Caldarchaeum sp.]
MVLVNHFTGLQYPSEGHVVGVLDTGYEGFAAVPEDVFRSLGLDQLRLHSRKVLLANGALLPSRGAYATLKIRGMERQIDGFVETYPGLGEILVGSEALTSFKIVLNYCMKSVSLEPCG